MKVKKEKVASQKIFIIKLKQQPDKNVGGKTSRTCHRFFIRFVRGTFHMIYPPKKELNCLRHSSMDGGGTIPDWVFLLFLQRVSGFGFGAMNDDVGGCWWRRWRAEVIRR